MKLIITDPHIEEKYIDELEKIFQEIYQQEADELIMCGDYYHCNERNELRRPSIKELLFGTKWAFKFKSKYKKTIFVKGNHGKSQNSSAIDYLQYLGIEIVGDYVDEYNNYYGHFMLYESKLEYGTGRCSIKDLKSKYNKIFLGHQHLKQEDYHLGSCRWVNFNEVEDKYKQIAIIENNKVTLIPLKSPIPMVDVKSVKELPNINPNTKVRCLVTSFDQFKREINEIPKWKDKFAEFKLKLDFSNTTITKGEKVVNKEKKNLTQLIAQYIEKIEDKDVKELLKKQM